ncbi:MAG: radical SAM protein [Chloroflexi bacterium]|nr:radical SAM protein [Chloroflexota bacterium]
MTAETKLALLGQAAQYDLCASCGTHAKRTLDDIGRWIYPAVMPDGKRINLLKVLQTNVCDQNCYYCANRCGRDIPRTSLLPEELARSFDLLQRSGRASGLFLSSGLCGNAGRATERMLATVELLRKRYEYRGYIHFKLLPGVDDALIECALRVAQRVSINLEAPNDARLHALSGTKHFIDDLLAPLRRAHQLRQELGAAVSMTTQLVVGGADESDREILSTASTLYRQLSLARTYYSAFQPVPDTPLENHPPTPAWREHRLYQADFLLRCYGFQFHELVFDRHELLPRATDPKTAWALAHPERFPMEVNRAEESELLRVPGIGPISARRLSAWRRKGAIRELTQLELAGADANRAAPFILLNGHSPSRQLPLWEQSALE